MANEEATAQQIEGRRRMVEEETEGRDEGITVEVQPYNEKPGKPQLSDEEVEKMDQLPPDDEIGRYAKDAQKRIKSLHIANQEWRRRVVQSTKDMATATTLAEQLYRENQQLRLNTQRSEQALIDQALGRAEAQLAQAKQRFVAARQANDPNLEVAAQEEIARCVAEADRLRLLRPAGPPHKDGEGSVTPPPTAAPAPPNTQPPPVSDGTKAWLGRNPWYNKPGEEELTHFALGVHESLEKQGITEINNPKDYWGTIDRRLREKFPERFEAQTERPTNGSRPVAVAGATRTNGTEPRAQRGPRHVVLSESQVKLARSFGLTNEQYAMQLIKDEQLPEGSYHDISTKR